MKRLVVGGAGQVGRVIGPAIEAEHACIYYDLRPVEGTACRTIIADVNDDVHVNEAVRGQEGILYMPLGTVGGDKRTNASIDPAFDVNAKGLYRFLNSGLAAGVRWFCYVSTLSVYDHLWADRPVPLSERDAADAVEPYGMSKRVGEFICEAYARRHPSVTIMSLRLASPIDEEGWRNWRTDARHKDSPPSRTPLAPHSQRQLFAAALRFATGGYHLIHATGDRTGRHFDGGAASQLLHWQPTAS